MSKFCLPFLLLLIILCVAAAYAADTIAEVKSLPDNTPVTLTGKVAVTSSGEMPYCVYIEEPDRSAGIQVRFSTSTYPGVVEGKIVNVSGKTSPFYTGERIITNGVIDVVGDHTPLLKPLGIRTRHVGGSGIGLQKGVKNGIGTNNIGMLVRVWGKVVSSDSTYRYFTLDDGSRTAVQVAGSLLSLQPSIGYYASVTGIVNTKTVGSDLIPVITPRRITDIKADLETQIDLTPIPAGKLGIFWLGQGGYLFKDHEGRKITVDPYLSDYCRLVTGSEWVRLSTWPVAPEKLKPGLTLVTHDHGDHTDPYTLRPIYLNSQSMFCGPYSTYVHLGNTDIGVPADRRYRLDRGQSWNWNGIQISAIYANHTNDSVGFIINMAGRKVYISGDTSYDATLVNAVKAANPDIMLVCINGKLGNMTADEAARLVKATNANCTIPMHYGMFSINTADPQTFVAACSAQGVTARVVVLPNYGFTVL